MSIIQECPCGLSQEELEKYKIFDDYFSCTSRYADRSLNDDGSFKICDKQLGAHPTEAQRAYRIQYDLSNYILYFILI